MEGGDPCKISGITPCTGTMPVIGPAKCLIRSHFDEASNANSPQTIATSSTALRRWQAASTSLAVTWCVDTGRDRKAETTAGRDADSRRLEVFHRWAADSAQYVVVCRRLHTSRHTAQRVHTTIDQSPRRLAEVCYTLLSVFV